MTTRRLLALAFLLFCAAAHAQKLAPGLWEHGVTVQAAGGQMDDAMAKMQAQMAAMPPDKRKMVEDMMAQRGITLGGNGRPTTVQVCLTPEQAARNEFPQDGRCTRDNLQRSGNTVHFKFSCSGPPPSSGEGEFTTTGDRAYTGKMLVDSAAQGKPVHMEMALSGKWLGADCGTVKPRP